MDNHMRDCRSGKTLFGGLLGLSGDVGFGSCINTALNAYFIPSEPETKKHHQFQLVTFDWIYEPLSSFFVDFAAGSDCPLFRDLGVPEAEQLLNYSLSIPSYPMIWKNNTVIINSNENFINHRISYDRFNLSLMVNTRRIYHRDGMELFFARKSAMLKSIWQPHPNFKRSLKRVWTSLLDYSGRFIGIHIRRGDKIAWNESADIPVSNYSDKIKQICAHSISFSTDNCPKNIFVMYDEKSAFDQLKMSLNSSFNVFDLETSVRRFEWNISAYIVTSVNERKHKTPPRDRSFWRVHTKQIIIEMTLLALSEILVCTMSSNICRLVALLRGHHQKNIFSLDGENGHLDKSPPSVEWYPW